MISYRPLPYTRLAQAAPAVAPPAAPAAAPAPAPAPTTTVEVPAPVSTGYSGVAGFLETVAVLAVTASAAWIGVRTGMSKQPNPYVKTAGWIGGIGSGLLGALYLGQKSGVKSGLPAVRVTA